MGKHQLRYVLKLMAGENLAFNCVVDLDQKNLWRVWKIYPIPWKHRHRTKFKNIGALWRRNTGGTFVSCEAMRNRHPESKNLHLKRSASLDIGILILKMKDLEKYYNYFGQF